MNKIVKPTFSIIIMRDDCNVSAFRLHSFWMKCLVLFFVLLLAACAAGTYASFYYKSRYESAAAERRELQRSLGESKIKLENLANEELVGRFTGAPAGNGFNRGLNSVVLPSEGGTFIPPPTESPPTREDLASLLNQLGPMYTAGPENEAELLAQMEKHPIRITNVKATLETDDRLRITYDLSNQQQGLTLTGRCNVALVTREGAVIDITSATRGVLTFQIARFRKMDILTRVPSSIKKDEIIGIQISAQANELPLYYRQFPLAR